MNYKATLQGLAILAALLLIGTGWLIQHILADHGRQVDAAVAVAKQQTALRKVTHTDYFAGDQVYYIVSGQDPAGRRMMVWVNGHAAHAEYADQGMSEAQIRQIWHRTHPAGRVIRIVPAVDGTADAWEVFCTSPDRSGARRYSYDYYRFSDGALLDDYTLGKA